MSGWKEGESLQRSPINFYFHRRNHRKLRSLKTVTGNKKCVSPWSITHIRPSQAPVTLVLSISSQILQLCTKTRLLKEAIGVNLLVWIVGYKLSQIYNIPWIEFSRDLLLQSYCVLFKLWYHHEIAFVTFHFDKKKGYSSYSGFLFFLRRSIFDVSAWIWNQLISLWGSF